MVSTSVRFSLDLFHQVCDGLWPELADRLRSCPPVLWPGEIVPWLRRFAATGVDELFLPGSGAEAPASARAAAVLVMINAMGRLHRARMGTVCDAFREARDAILRDLRTTLSAQEVVMVLDLVDFDGRSLELSYLQTAA